MVALLLPDYQRIPPIDSAESSLKSSNAPAMDIAWPDHRFAEPQQTQPEEVLFSDGSSSTDGSVSEGSDSETDDEASLRQHPLSGAYEYAPFIPQSLSLPQGLGIHSDDGEDLSELEEASSMPTSRRPSITARTGPSNRVASSVSFRGPSSISTPSMTSPQYAPQYAPVPSRRSDAMTVVIEKWHRRRAFPTTGFDSDDSDASEPESIKDKERDRGHLREGVTRYTSTTIELEQESSDARSSASSCSSSEGSQQTAKRSAASRKLFAALNNREGKTEATDGDDQPLRLQHQISSRTKALSHRRGHRALPSLHQIQCRIAGGPSSTANLHTHPQLRSEASSPDVLLSHYTPAPKHDRIASCPTPSLSGKWWQFGQVSVIISPPTPCPQPNSPLIGYILQNAGSPVHVVKFRRSNNDLAMLAPPPFELAPGRQAMTEERDRGRASAQARQSQEQVMAALSAMRLAAERESNILGRRSSLSNGSGQAIGLGWPGSPGTPLPPMSAGGFNSSNLSPSAGLLPMSGTMLPPFSLVPSSAPASVNVMPSRTVDFVPDSLPRRPMPMTAGPTAPHRRGNRKLTPPSTAKYVAPGRGDFRRAATPAGLPNCSRGEGETKPAKALRVASTRPLTSALGEKTGQSEERASAGRNLLIRLERRRGGSTR